MDYPHHEKKLVWLPIALKGRSLMFSHDSSTFWQTCPHFFNPSHTASNPTSLCLPTCIDKSCPEATCLWLILGVLVCLSEHRNKRMCLQPWTHTWMCIWTAFQSAFVRMRHCVVRGLQILSSWYLNNLQKKEAPLIRQIRLDTCTFTCAHTGKQPVS